MAMAVASGPGLCFATQLPALHLPWAPRPLPASISLASSARVTAPFSGLAAIASSRETQAFDLSNDSSQPSLSRDQTANGSADQAENGPIEIPAQADPLAIPENSPLRTAGGVVLTGAIAFFLFRSLRKRAQRSKEMKFRSSGVERVKAKEAREETSTVIPVLDGKLSPPSAIQTILGAILSGGFAYILYNFATHVNEGFSRQTVSSTYTIRQLTITVRTIVNGLCYLATFIFAANSIGLALYSLQLAFNFGQSQSPGGGEDEVNNDSKLVEAVSEEVAEKE